MSIFNHFPNLSLSADQKTTLTKLETFLNSSTQIFMLKGYAGSGKTTILKGLVEYLDSTERKFILMAPTGRAAKNLRDKTNYGKTIHSCIYDFKKIKTTNSESEELADHSFHFFFPIANNLINKCIIIVDEASLISNREAKNEFFTFGSNILLKDLLTYARLAVSKNKIIFVGDPAQLPPVNDNISSALQEIFFDEQGLGHMSTEMKHVLRQSNLILQNAITIRGVIESTIRNTLHFEYDETSFRRIRPEFIVSKYLELYPNPEIGSGIIIAFSNTQCLAYNRAIREKFFPYNKEITEGDILSINNNNYHTYGTEIFNGDMAVVVKVSTNTESQSAPVWVDEGGKKVKKIFTIVFRDVEIQITTHSEIISCKIIDSLLNSADRDLNINELRSLYINFVMRFKNEQNTRKENGLEFFKVGSEQFLMKLKTDLYLNSIRVKYGYAVTCHKAQGGEWDTIFVDYYGRVGLGDAQLRWCYTATTRGINHCYVVNPPHFGQYSKLIISNIIISKKFPENALNLKNVPLSPFHNENQHRCKSLKYWEIAQKLKNTQFEIEKVESLGDFQERYHLKHDIIKIIIDTHHNKAGFFQNFRLVTKTDISDTLLTIINAPMRQVYNIDYTPFNTELEKLFSTVQNYCDELDITITSIEENITNSFVRYCFNTSGTCSVIQFYFNKSFQFTTAMPKSDLGEQDIKLTELIQKLSLNAR